MTERVLTQRDLNRAVLARQLLLERERHPVPRAVERLGAIQGQWSLSPYIALWSRLEGFERDQLTRAFEKRRVVKATLMRITLHVISARDFLALAPIWIEQRREEFRRKGQDPDELERQLRAALAEQHRTHSELYVELPDVYTWRVRSLVPLVHVPPSGTWRYHGPTQLTEAERWLKKPPGDPASGARLLVERYLGAFGPASQSDLLRFSGARVKDVKPGLDALEKRIVRYRSEDGRELLDLRGAPLPDPETDVPARFLPKWDSAILAYDRRGRILPDAYAKTVIKVNGDVVPTFLVDGLIAGQWDVQRKKDAAALTLTPYARVSKAWKQALEEEGERLLRWHEPDAASFALRWS
jgi:Winged helix DNA-binding domain